MADLLLAIWCLAGHRCRPPPSAAVVVRRRLRRYNALEAHEIGTWQVEQSCCHNTAEWWYGNFDIIMDHLWGTSGLFTTPHTPCAVLYLVTMRIGC